MKTEKEFYFNRWVWINVQVSSMMVGNVELITFIRLMIIHIQSLVCNLLSTRALFVVALVFEDQSKTEDISIDPNG